MRALVFLSVPLLLLGACTSSSKYDGQPLAKMTFDHVKPYSVYTASYEVVPYANELLLPETFIANPANFARDYLQSRFEPVGTQGKLRAVIHDVSVTHDRQAQDNKVGALMGLGGQDHYYIEMKIGVEAYGTSQFDRQATTLTARRNVYISEHVSIVEREELQMKALDSLIDDIDVAMRKVLKDDLRLMR